MNNTIKASNKKIINENIVHLRLFLFFLVSYQTGLLMAKPKVNIQNAVYIG